HDQPVATGTSVGVPTLGQQNLYDLNLDGVFETALYTPPTFAITPGRSIDPEFHQPFIQEWGVGYAKQLPSRLTASVDVVHRDFRDRTTAVETNSRFDGNVFAGYLDEAFNQTYKVTNNRWNWPVYTGLELALTAQTARLQAIASYV